MAKIVCAAHVSLLRQCAGQCQGANIGGKVRRRVMPRNHGARQVELLEPGNRFTDAVSLSLGLRQKPAKAEACSSDTANIKPNAKVV